MSHHNNPPYNDGKGNRVEPQKFRVLGPAAQAAYTVRELADYLLHEFEDGNSAWPNPDPWLPTVTRVDSVRVFTSADGLDGDLADQVGRVLEHRRAVVLIEGMAVPALKQPGDE